MTVGMINLAFGQCLPPTAFEYLDVNNAKVGIRNGGDMWWNGQVPGYEIPAGSNKHSWFSGGLWIGGLDASGALHLAATTWLPTDLGYFSGPLDVNGETDPYSCVDADRIFKLNRHEVDQFRFLFNQAGYTIPQDILEWPAIGNPHASFHADAPFVDVNNDQVYNALDGDYPAFSFDGSVDMDHDLLGDQCLWWVINDNGDLPSPIASSKLDFEIQCMAYAFGTCDELDDQTLYRYTINNKSGNEYHDVSIGLWTDPDLGNSEDDYVGCDVMRSMGYVYNGDAFDGTSGSGPTQYSDNPPSAGIDILRGPLADSNDGVDNNRDGVIDEPGEQLVMSKFLYAVRADLGPPWGSDPNYPSEFYNYLNGIWLDGTPFCYGGTGHPAGGCNGVEADFMFPGDSDPQGFGTGMTPQPAWTEQTANNPIGDRRMLQSVGPFTLNSGETETLHFAALWAWDQFGPEPFSSVELMLQASDSVQHKFDNGFEGMGCCAPVASISVQEFETFTYVFSPNSVGAAYSWDFGDGISSSDPYPIHEYADYGSYQVCLTVTNDCGSDQICEWITIAPTPQSILLKRIEGQGNGNRVLDFTDYVHDQVLNASNHRIDHPTYYFNQGPVRVEVLDEALVPSGDIAIRLDDVTQDGGWKMYVIGQTDTIFSSTTIQVGDAQLVTQWGLLIQVKQTENWDQISPDCVIDASVDFLGNDSWLTGLSDSDYPHYTNWIRSGTAETAMSDPLDYAGIDDYECFEHVLNGTWAPYRLACDRTIDSIYLPVAWEGFRSFTRIGELASVDLVITPDQSKWTRCAVIETGLVTGLNQGGIEAHRLRDHVSVDKNGDPDASGTMGMSWFPGYAINLETGERLNIMFGENSSLPNDNGQDMIWNPTSTFGPEDYPVVGGGHYIYIMGHNHGDDTERMPLYDEGQFIYQKLSANNFDPQGNDMRKVYGDAMWVTPPLLEDGHNLLESEVHVRLRVKKPYAQYETTLAPINSTNPLYCFNATQVSSSISDEGEEAVQVLVFPNPSDGNFTVSHPDLRSIQIHAVDGRMVYSEPNVSDGTTVTLNEAAGLYFVVVSTDKEDVVKKLVLQ